MNRKQQQSIHLLNTIPCQTNNSKKNLLLRSVCKKKFKLQLYNE